MSLTARQQQIVDFLRQYLASEGMPPTQAEIATRFGFTQKAAGDHLKLIAAKGAIELRRDIPRGIRLREGDRQPVPAGGACLPLLERLTPGLPRLAGQFDQLLPIAPSMFRPAADYLRRMAGNSLVDIGIQDGDLIGVKQTLRAEHNQVIVAKLFSRGGVELTVRRLRRSGDALFLLPGGAGLEPLAVVQGEALSGAPSVEIEGLYCGHLHPHSA
ncbi:MAG: transcriptional repressor LexA [Nevskia sp.]|nr:transcriptional repressor LexA [Nevskia sp.]